MVDYNRLTMGFVLYDNGEIEIVEETEETTKWHMYFRDIYDLAYAINKTKPKLAKQLKELL